ncbi:MAG: alpha/beta hydrolase-fold protein [Pseudomonadota bacterium]
MLRALLIPGFLFILTACGKTEADVSIAQVTINAIVPANTGTVYVTGDNEQFGPWNADGLAMTGAGSERSAQITLQPTEELLYKFTLGEWSREAVDENLFPYQNFALVAEDGMSVTHDIAGFKPPREALLDDWKGSGVLGTLVHETDVPSEFLELDRNMTIWLPPGYEDPQHADKRYPVIYMTDGENLFDPRMANTGVDWGVDEAMMAGVQAGAFEPAIIVSTWSTAQRFEDYSPWHNGMNYARFVTEELKPRIDQTYRTLTDRENTYAMGSSMGGLLAMYMVTQHADTFSACGCVSTHVPLSDQMIAMFTGGDASAADPTPYITKDINEGRFVPAPDVRYFFDYGTEGLDAMYGPVHAELQAHFTALNRQDGEDFLIRLYPGADHNETSWRARVGDQLLWLLAGQAPDED